MEKIQSFCAVTRLLKFNSVLYFIDEAVFTSKLNQVKVWAKYKGPAPTVFKHKIGFKAIAVTSAINMEGNIVTTQITDYSVSVEKFIQFLQDLRSLTCLEEQIYIYIDNLRVHHSTLVKEFCTRNNIGIVFAASYSSMYNPIERVWALAKKIFQRKLVASQDLS